MARAFLAGAVAALFATAVAASATTSTGFTFDGWHVRTGAFQFDWKSGDFTAPGRIHMSRGGQTIDANHATGNEKERRATLDGDVTLHDEGGGLSSLGAGSPSDPSDLSCDRLVVDGVAKMYTATGHVHFRQGASSIRADEGTLNAMTHELQLHGNVHVDR